MQDFSGILGRLNEMSEGRFYQETIHPVDSIIRYVDSEHRRNKGDLWNIRFILPKNKERSLPQVCPACGNGLKKKYRNGRT